MVPVYCSPPSQIILSPSLEPDDSSAHHRGDERLSRYGPHRFRKCGADTTGFTQVLYRRSGEDAVKDAILRLIVDFSHTLGLKVTAEGVEKDRRVASLTAMRCDLAQGFYFSKPLPGEAAGALVATTLCGGCLDRNSSRGLRIWLRPTGYSRPSDYSKIPWGGYLSPKTVCREAAPPTNCGYRHRASGFSETTLKC